MFKFICDDAYETMCIMYFGKSALSSVALPNFGSQAEALLLLEYFTAGVNV